MCKFLAIHSQEFFEQQIDDEISKKIIPHLEGTADSRYLFRSSEEMIKLHMKGNLVTHGLLRKIEEAAGKMSQTEGDAFRFIAYRDLTEAMAMYLEFAEKRARSPRPILEKSVASAV